MHIPPYLQTRSCKMPRTSPQYTGVPFSIFVPLSRPVIRPGGRLTCDIQQKLAALADF
jgi:hypothetical protein